MLIHRRNDNGREDFIKESARAQRCQRGADMVASREMADYDPTVVGAEAVNHPPALAGLHLRRRWHEHR